MKKMMMKKKKKEEEGEEIGKKIVVPMNKVVRTPFISNI